MGIQNLGEKSPCMPKNRHGSTGQVLGVRVGLAGVEQQLTLALVGRLQAAASGYEYLGVGVDTRADCSCG